MNRTRRDAWPPYEPTRRVLVKRVDHPAVGPILVDCDVLTDGDAELKIVILSATPGTEDETKFKLAVLSGVHTAPQEESADGANATLGANISATAASNAAPAHTPHTTR